MLPLLPSPSPLLLVLCLHCWPSHRAAEESELPQFKLPHRFAGHLITALKRSLSAPSSQKRSGRKFVAFVAGFTAGHWCVTSHITRGPNQLLIFFLTSLCRLPSIIWRGPRKSGAFLHCQCQHSTHCRRYVRCRMHGAEILMHPAARCRSNDQAVFEGHILGAS